MSHKYLANIVQIIVLAARANALLRVNRTPQRRERAARITLAQEKRLKLVHASISEKQSGILVGHDRTRRPECVALTLKKLNERFADLFTSPHLRGWSRRDSHCLDALLQN